MTVFISWFFVDCAVSRLLVLHGNGEPYDEFGLFPTATVSERMFAVLFYFVFSFGMAKGCSLLSLRWYKHQSFVALHLLFFAQMRLPSVKEAWNDLHSESHSLTHWMIYGYFLISFCSHVGFCLVKWNSDLVKPVWLARLYLVQLPIGNVITLFFVDKIMNASVEAFTVGSIIITISTIILGPVMDKFYPVLPSVHPSSAENEWTINKKRA